MRLRLKQEKNNYGLVTVETSPQVRTFFSNNKKVRISLPFLYHNITYEVDKRTVAYKYRTLSVCLATERIDSINNLVHDSPTDPGGYVCLPHMYDGLENYSLKRLVSQIVDIWWGLDHNIDFGINCKKIPFARYTQVNYFGEFALIDEPFGDKND